MLNRRIFIFAPSAPKCVNFTTHPSVPRRPRHQGVDAVGGEAVDALVKGLLPGPHVRPAPRVPQPGEGVVAAGEEGAVAEPDDVQHAGPVLELEAHVEDEGAAGEVVQPQGRGAPGAS